MKNSDSPSFANQDWKMARFSFRAALFLISGGWGLAVPFYSLQGYNLGQNIWKIKTPSSPPSLRLENGAF